MGINEHIRELVFRQAAVEGTLAALVKQVETIDGKLSTGGFSPSLVRVLAVCFSGVFGWLGVLTFVFLRG